MPYKDYEKAKQNARENYYKNREKKKQQSKEYYFAHWEAKQEQRATWLAANPEKMKTAQKKSREKWKAAHPKVPRVKLSKIILLERSRESNRLWRKSHPEKVGESWKVWALAHPETAKESIRHAQKKYRENNLEKAAAHARVHRAVKSGLLIKPKKCEDCEKEAELQGHHHNGYEEESYLDIVWLCVPCHNLHHYAERTV